MEDPFERAVVVDGEDRAVPSWSVLQLKGRGEGAVGVCPSELPEFLLVDGRALLIEQA